MQIGIPYHSQYDPVYTSDGSLDPIGLFPIADRLAMRLTPGIRERMSHPRFLTAMAVGAVICSDFDHDEISADNVSEPWQVYEWYVVQALVRTFYQNREEIRGLPGSDKALRAYLLGLPLNSARYLKTASVFGFHGVYRTLAHEIQITDNYNNLGEVGDRLVRIWEKSQKLDGFYTSYSGPGRNLRNDLLKAVKDGMTKGEVSRGWGWGCNTIISKHLAPYHGTKPELDVIYNAIIDETAPLRAEIIKFLQSEKGKSIWLKSKSEKEFHLALIPIATEELKNTLRAILSYEQFSSLINNAFTAILYELSHSTKLTLDQLSQLETVKRATRESPGLFQKTYDNLGPVDEANTFYQNFVSLSEPNSLKEWIQIFIHHHKQNQKRKSVSGKRPWIEQVSADSFMMQTRYRIDKNPIMDDEYVSFYRTNSLWSFLKDMKRV